MVVRPAPLLAGFLLPLAGAISGCGGMDLWDRPYVSAAHSSAPRAPASQAAPTPSAPVPEAQPEVQPRALPPRPRAPAGHTDLGQPAAEDQAMFDEVNRIRASRGLRSFRWSATLYLAACEHSAEQNRFGYMGHGSPDPRRDDLGDRVRQAGYSARGWAEVVTWGYRGPADVVEGWMNSSGHRHILLDADLVDAGFSRVGDYFTGDFGTPATSRRR